MGRDAPAPRPSLVLESHRNRCGSFHDTVSLGGVYLLTFMDGLFYHSQKTETNVRMSFRYCRGGHMNRVKRERLCFSWLSPRLGGACGRKRIASPPPLPHPCRGFAPIILVRRGHNNWQVGQENKLTTLAIYYGRRRPDPDKIDAWDGIGCNSRSLLLPRVTRGDCVALHTIL